MWTSSVRQVSRAVARRSFSTEAAPAAVATTVKLNFTLPHTAVYKNAEIYQVIIPGVDGEYGVTANHVSYLAQLKPGVLQILHEEGNDPEKYFVAGGYAFTHPDSTTDVVCPEAVKLDDIDPSAVSSQYEAAKAAFNSASTGSIEQAEAQIAMEVNKNMGMAVGVNLS
jgi:F-type H+-transporting ATPase subunit delta